MDHKKWYIVWLILFIFCGILGFIPEPKGFLKGLMVLLSVCFFIPGFVLLHRSRITKNKNTAKQILILSSISLGSTLLLLLANLLSGQANAVTGDLLYGFLVILSAPMICSQYWIVSLFLWACLLFSSISLWRQYFRSHNGRISDSTGNRVDSQNLG